nr:probable cation-transporting ATPase 13A3 [Leptinotarsa decemlineata]
MSSQREYSSAVSHGGADVERNEEQIEDLLRGPKTDEFTMYLNKGEDDEMQLVCYKESKFKLIVTHIFFLLTIGILRLIFHWIPHLYLYATSYKCKVEDADRVLVIELYNGNHKIYHVRGIHTITPASIAKLQKDTRRLNHNQIPVSDAPPGLSVHFENGEFRELDKLHIFSCKKVTYIWNNEKREFMKLAGLEAGVACNVFHRYRPLTDSEQFMRLLVYGKNLIDVKQQTIFVLLCAAVLSPFYVFQVWSFILWVVDNYYYYGSTIVLLSLFGIGMSVKQTRENQKNLQSTIHSSDVCTILRHPVGTSLDGVDGSCKTETISTELLVPGDIMEIPSYGCTMHCDAVLLTGTCIVNESMLTGESVPVTKTSLPRVQISYDPKEHGRHTLFCGTRVIQTRYFGNEKVLAIVVRTGFSTAKGSLVRSILYPPPVDFRFEKDSYRFVGFLSLVAICGVVYTVVTKIMRRVGGFQLTLEALDLITVVVPPALPAAMTVGMFYAQSRLKKKQIYCISPRSINVSGSINCVCFDKTGTLTEDGLDMQCVVPANNKHFKSAVTNVETLPYDVLLFGLVSCHSLTIIDKQIVGDPLDLKMFESTKWVMEEYEVADNNKFDMIYPTVLKPPKNRPNEHQNITDDVEIGIIKEFPFSSNCQRMGVIIRRLGGTHFEYYCKGSPEMLLNFINPDTVPVNFSDILESYTEEGYRVIALAHKKLKMSYAKVQKVQREAIEKDLDFLGFIILENRLKPETTPSIQELNDADIRVIMVTGDNILTALSVAKDCDIVTANQSIISVNCDDNEPPNLYYTLTSTKAMPSDVSILTNSASAVSLETIESQVHTLTNDVSQTGCSRPSMLLNNYRFAMTGKVWEVIKEHYPDLLPRICTRGTIFARMAPEQKQQLVQELQGLGYCVAMCGDGANDCGALKAAHTGISLSDAESSVASPFTSRNPNIDCVIQVIKEGRAALITSFGIFKYMASYSMCQFVTVLHLYSIESNLTDFEFLYIDLAMISVFAFCFGRTETYPGKLVKETPLSSLVSLTPMLSMILQSILVVFFQEAALQHLKSEPWYVPLNTTKDEEVACVENYTLFTISSFQYIILVIVFSKGYPYRKSIFSNWGFLTSILIMTSVSVYLTLFPVDFLIRLFELVLPEDFNFRLYLLGYAGAHFILALLVEYLIVDEIFFKRLRFKFHNLDKSRRKYLAIERDLNRDRKWPVLTSDFQSAASPSSPEPVFNAEIVIEKEKFTKDHVLNKLYEASENPFENPLNSESSKITGCSENITHSPRNVAEFQVNGVVGLGNACATGYFSQEDLLFSSLPSDTQTSPSDTFKSLSNNTNTNYDLTNSNANIPELPFDEKTASPKNTQSASEKMGFGIVFQNISEKSPQRNIQLLKSMKIQNSPIGTPNKDVGNFNSFGRSPPQTQVIPKPLEMNNFEMNS